MDLHYGSALLAGKDQFAETGLPSLPEWHALEEDIKNDLKQQLWPELRENKSRKAKKDWRSQEIKALSEAIGK